MKHIIAFLVFTTIAMGLFAQSDFYYTDKGEKVSLKIRKDKVILKIKSAKEVKALTKQTAFLSAYDVSSDMVIATIDTLQIKTHEDLLQRSDVIDATYALEYADGTLLYPTDRISVKFKEGQSVKKILNDTGLNTSVESIELFDPYSEIYIITLNVKSGDILRICRNLFETGLY